MDANKLPTFEKPFWVLNVANGMKMDDCTTAEIAVGRANALQLLHKQTYAVVNVVAVYVTPINIEDIKNGTFA